MPGTNIIVRINKPAELGGVVTGFEVVEAGVGIEVVTPVAEGVDVGHVAGGGEDLAPGVVGVAGLYVPAGIQYVHHVALEIGDVVVHHGSGGGAGLVGEGIGGAALIVEELQLLPGPVLGDQPAALPHILVLYITHGLGEPEPVGIVGIAVVEAGSGVLGGHEPASQIPGEGGAVMPGGGVAYGVVGDCVTVIGGEQVLPLGVPIGVGVGAAAVGGGEDVPPILGVGLKPRAGVPAPDGLKEDYIDICWLFTACETLVNNQLDLFHSSLLYRENNRWRERFLSTCFLT